VILVCGSLADGVTELVCARFEDCRYPYRLLDITDSTSRYEVDATLHGERPHGFISAGGWRLDLEDISGVFVRLHAPADRWPQNQAASRAYALDVERRATLIALLDGLPCPVINRQLRTMSNYSKPYQALLIRECGFLIPPTVVTNDPAEARHFIASAPGDVIYKALSGEGSIVRTVGANDLERLEKLKGGPAQFQHRIQGENIRVHTVGDRLFPTLVRSDSVDYRHPTSGEMTVEMEPADLPRNVAMACLRLARVMGLELAGIDLMRTLRGDYFCFEVNPAPAFLLYESLAAQKISLALADLLHGG